MANPKQFVRNKSHRQFFGFYSMNWSTRLLKEKPFHLKTKSKPSVSVSLEAAMRWCWVLVPSPAPWAARPARLCKRHSEERDVEWELQQMLKNSQMGKSPWALSIVQPSTSPAFSVTKKCPPAHHPAAVGGSTDIPPWVASPGAPERDDGPPACWLSNSCPPGTTLHAVTSWKEINSPER